MNEQAYQGNQPGVVEDSVFIWIWIELKILPAGSVTYAPSIDVLCLT